jgi:predicted RNA methylase
MKLKHLESALSRVPTPRFVDPKVELEQYPTSPHLTAAVVLNALERGDLGPERTALDLGCGTGLLSMACALVGTQSVLGVDCDPDALQITQDNVQIMMEEYDYEEMGVIELLHAKVRPPPPQLDRHNRQGSNHKGRGTARGGKRNKKQTQRHLDPSKNPNNGQNDDDGNDGVPLMDGCVDTVVTNPPFGTKQFVWMDLQFVKIAIRLARRAVYSFHKTSTRGPLVKKILAMAPHCQVDVVAQMKFDIPQMYKFHKQASVDVEVDLIRITLPQNKTIPATMPPSISANDEMQELDPRQEEPLDPYTDEEA